MFIKWIPFFILEAIFEGGYQICFKKGTSDYTDVSGIKYYLKLLSNKWIIIGLISALIEMIVWIFIVEKLPLSIAFPLTGMQSLTIICTAIFILKEKISKVEWIGIIFIIAGICIIARSI
jgi:undecaprenyl phosphate-alpha-L-ara4N flippase subunit ArnE